MQTRIRFFLLFALVILVTAIFVVSSSLLSKIGGNAYLTPIPESTWSAYHQKKTIANKFEAVLAATQLIHVSRMRFTQGEPKVVYVEKMHVEEASELLGMNFEASKNTKVWVVVFEGQWQILPPMSNELLALESGCIYVALSADKQVGSGVSTAECRQLP